MYTISEINKQMTVYAAGTLEQNINKCVPKGYHSQVCQGDSTVDMNGLISSHQLLLFLLCL